MCESWLGPDFGGAFCPSLNDHVLTESSHPLVLSYQRFMCETGMWGLECLLLPRLRSKRWRGGWCLLRLATCLTNVSEWKSSLVVPP